MRNNERILPPCNMQQSISNLCNYARSFLRQSVSRKNESLQNEGKHHELLHLGRKQRKKHRRSPRPTVTHENVNCIRILRAQGDCICEWKSQNICLNNVPGHELNYKVLRRLFENELHCEKTLAVLVILCH